MENRILEACMREGSADPIEVLQHLMAMDGVHMHGPEHHMLVGAALMTAYRNAGGRAELETAIPEVCRRAKEVPGGVCGLWGCCGAAISAGIFASVATGSSPLAKEQWALCNYVTSECLQAISSCGGPRCCKRDSYLAIGAAVRAVAEKLGVVMETHEFRCSHSARNAQCIGVQCPFHA